MSSTIQQIEQEALHLPQAERVELIHRLLDSVAWSAESEVATKFTNGNGHTAKQAQELESARLDESSNPWLELAEMVSGGPGDSAERAEEIIREEINSTSGLTTHQ